ncbi:MAG: response regulator, partial [Caedimonadaceae bacterium]
MMMNQKNQILIVDDDNRIRELIQKYLLTHGYLVTTAADTKEAHEILTTQNIDLMILDNLMPGQKGIDYLKELRANIKHPKHRIP